MTTTSDHGDFVDSDEELDFIEFAEDPERYVNGLFYPVCVGDILAGRYRIEHKLGHGGFSVVWMAHDLHRGRDVALKIMVPGDIAADECQAQADIARAVSDTSRLLLHQGSFLLNGSHDQHLVFVLPLLGPNLRDYVREKPIAARMLAAKQLLQAVVALHEGGFVHRDLNDANVMFGLLPISGSDTAAKYRCIGRPQKVDISEDLWKPGELVKPMAPPKELVTDNVLLGDFGLTFRAGARTISQAKAPAAFCAPEQVHCSIPTFASDVWSYMCLFAELYLGNRLFGSSFFGGQAHSTVIDSIVNKLGPLPAHWEGRYDYDAGTADPEWYNQLATAHPTLALEKYVPWRRPDITKAELQLVTTILRWGLSYLPKDRPTAAQLLHSDAFNELMAIYS